MKVLNISNLSFSYRNDIVLDNVSFSINEGDFVALNGSNGSGKSTLLKLILGFIQPSNGTIAIDTQKFPIAYIPQGGIESIDFIVSVNELLKFRNVKSSQSDIDKALSQVAMKDFKKYLVKNLSGGQRQRVLIARELMNHPKIIFLDEPTTGLDRDSIAMLYNLLIDLNKQGITIVLVTHHIDDVFKGINRIFEVVDHKVEELVHV